MAKKARTSDSVGVHRKIGQNTRISSVRLLVKLMVANDLSELDIVDGEVKVHLKRGPAYVQAPSAPMALAPASALPAAAPAASAPAAAPAAPAAPKEKLLEIKSPMVGTFYAAPSPDSEPYASVGKAIGDESVVCIVEAMKVMNEIKAECSGTIAEICVQNAQPVEYGQVLFRVRPR